MPQQARYRYFLLIFPLILGIFSLLIFFSNGFRVKKIVKKGFVRSSSGVVDRFVKKGELLFLVDTRKIEKELLKDVWVKSAEVRVALPSTVIIKVVEREPVALYINNGSLFYVDRE